MSRQRVGIACFAFIAALVLAPGCSDDDERAGGGGNIFGTGGSGASTAGGGTGGAAGSDLDAGDADTGGTGGAAGQSGGTGGGTGGDAAPDGPAQEPGVCGDDVLSWDEQCDGNDFGGLDCIAYGFTEGQLTCTDCQIETTGCSGVEDCFDGKDNDGDALIDCADDDCTTDCGDPCSHPGPLTDPSTVSGSNVGRSEALEPSCVGAGLTSGAEIVYEVTPANTGVMLLELSTVQANFNLSVRTSCNDAGTESGCVDYQVGQDAVERLQVPCEQGTPLYVVVDGSGASEASPFELSVASQPIECGNGTLEPGEECDDGNNAGGDACDPNCNLLASESEPNDSSGEADANDSPFVGSIDPAGDVDVVAITVGAGTWSIVVDAYDIGNGDCGNQLMDPVVDILGTDGTTVLASDDDGGSQFCSHAYAGQLPAGEYFVKIYAAGAAPPTFTYAMNIQSDLCGNGFQADGEECDDGNTTAGDGCAPDCTLE